MPSLAGDVRGSRPLSRQPTGRHARAATEKPVAEFAGHGVPVCLPRAGATGESGGIQVQGRNAAATGRAPVACRQRQRCRAWAWRRRSPKSIWIWGLSSGWWRGGWPRPGVDCGGARPAAAGGCFRCCGGPQWIWAATTWWEPMVVAWVGSWRRCCVGVVQLMVVYRSWRSGGWALRRRLVCVRPLGMLLVSLLDAGCGRSGSSRR